MSSERAINARAAGRGAWFAVLALLAAVWSPAPPSLAHGPDGSDAAVEVRVDPLGSELAGVRVQVRETVAYQLVVENTTDRVLEVLDERGAPFVRIGPQGVEANLTAPAWYRSVAPEGRVPKGLQKAVRSDEPPAPRWVLARREPSWGWFDARLAPGAHAGKTDSAAAQRWEIPVRIGGERSALRGRFVAAAPRTGARSTRLISDPQLAPGVRISLLPGEAGSFFLESASEQPVTVLGRDGEPFVRLGPSGTEANLHSATFAEVARLRGGTGLLLEPRADVPPKWRRVSPAPSYAWVDLRTAYDGEVPDAVKKSGKPAELLRWAVPVRIGAGDDAALVRVEGVTEWKPFPVEAARPSH
jgi:hypothetical protein